MNIVERLRELSKEASKPLWIAKYEGAESFVTMEGDSGIVVSTRPSDAFIIAEMRNNIDALLDLVEAVQHYRKAIKRNLPNDRYESDLFRAIERFEEIEKKPPYSGGKNAAVA